MTDTRPTPRAPTISGWRKATYSNPDQSCVEIGHLGAAVGVRDTKNRTAGTLAFPKGAWVRFLSQVTRT
ncbi:DUF397 domain-containing protein [Umezawaea sp.]|uniref:DUF397 domain-containing protein n=1 Tax=Umezawaea sp. TaxID=1955258 RepID=UPI002ED18080